MIMPSLAQRLVPQALFRGEFMNRAGQAGPRRLIVIAGIGVGMAALVTGAMLIGTQGPPGSKSAKMPYMNPLPGGLQSNPEQDALALRAGQEAAQKALAGHQSYTPPMAASQTMQPAKIVDNSASEVPTAAPVPIPAAIPQGPRGIAAPAPVRIAAAYAEPGTQPAAAQQPATDPQAQQAYRRALDNLFEAFSGRPPRTDIVLPVVDPEEGTAGSPADRHTSQRQAEDTHKAIMPASVVSDPVRSEAGKVLVPAGRGIYAHSVLAVNSDTGGPLVLQADSGPIAGDRMIATFTKNGTDRLVVRVTTVEHHGLPIEANAIIVAPDTMETAVATSVDEHYLERFILPAAASFVQGLGQAIATTSNSTAVVSPLGGATTTTHLNIGQQLGVGAGTAAQQVGSALNQEAPKGPTVNLAANANLGVMFLGNLVGPE
jgi:intracellular multiplication protein IcmE